MIAIEKLESDLRPFTDVATEFSTTSAGHRYRVRLFRNGSPREYLIDRETGQATARHDGGRSYPTLGSLLASPEFADLRRMAENQRRILRDFDPTQLIPPEGFIDDKTINDQRIADAATPHAANGAAIPPVDGNTIRVLLIDGPAGVGKTSLITRILVERAEAYAKGGTAPPLLHVTSRGRRLTGLLDTLAFATQLVRASFTYDQVPVLVRHGLLQVAIDGFDELVDADGYKDAWYALRDFLRDVETGGPVILAGRDTFFDQQGFLRHLEDDKSRVNLTLLHLGPVGSQTAKQWLKRRGWNEASIQMADDWELFSKSSYALRPYFLSVLAELKNADQRDLLTNPRDFLVRKFIDREAHLVSRALSLHHAEAANLITRLFISVAQEMADGESDTIDLTLLQFLIEVTFADVVKSDDLAKLKYRSGSIGLLDKDVHEGRRRFPHTEISHHFLAQGLLDNIEKGEISRFLRRGVLGIDFLEIFVDAFYDLPESSAKSVISKLEDLISREGNYDRLGANLRALTIATLSRDLGTAVRDSTDATVDEATILDTAARAKLSRATISRFDVRSTDLRNVEFTDCQISTLVVDEATKFGNSFPSASCLQVEADGKASSTFDPAKISQWFEQHSEKIFNASLARGYNPYVRLLERICYRTIRTHLIRESGEDPGGALLRDPQWPAIEAILRSHNRIEERENLQASGPNSRFVHIRNSRELLAREPRDATAKAIWAEVSSLGSPKAVVPRKRK